jgi:lupus La protein
MTSISPDLDKQIIRQIEYYFSDVNMVRDKFLQNEVIKDDGWIPLSVLTTFKRLQILTTDFKTIMNALRKSFSGLLQLNETENKIRRHPNRPLAMNQEELDSSLKNRTIFVKGFPMTDDDVTLDKLLHFFDKYGSTDNIQMKKDYKTKHFNGLVSVVFPSEEKARGFMEHSKRTPVKYDDGSILECSFQNDQSKEKKQKELPTKSNETLANLTGALIHLAGKTNSMIIQSMY